GVSGAAAAVARSGWAHAQERRLVIPTYGGRYEKFWREVLLPPFQQRTGQQPVFDIGLGANFAASLRATGPEKPVYSYLMANQVVDAVLRAERFFEPWPATRLQNLAITHAQSNPASDLCLTL